ncbi:ATP-dependent helicase HrpB [Silicimonas sp. MF1-12-2]|uniref:ATP-dependent helicase HrpB n=1 Tax=Silicimonas sp. MF1-12-2 TaxID=3384793 RepID=UPI0039B3D1ED
MDRLPIDDALPDLIDALRKAGRAVLQAPPGAGKTTRVPLAMLDAGLTAQKIVMLEPRRLAARAAAGRMAETLGEDVGQTVGYRIRGEAKTSKSTRIEVVTEGILTRMIQSDPSLDGIGAVIFDEFHERSLNADLGLALALEVRTALRDDLILVAMSATLDAAPVARLMDDAPVITSEGQSFPVETVWLDRPLPRDIRFERAMADLIHRAAHETTGGMLAFLPGEGEIRRVAAALDLHGIEILPLYGALPFAAQQKALAPAKGRKLVLATAIAETSLTIPDIRVVIDGGRARRARFDPGSGMSRLVTERVTRAEADQRRGRAGRVAEGTCYRLWTKGEEGALDAYPPAEIEAADLAGLALELAEWGSDDLRFLTRPPERPLAESRSLLADLGALDAANRITEHGRTLAAMPLHPRLAHMLAVAGKTAAPLAALLADQDPLRGAGADLSRRLAALSSDRRDPRLDRIRAEARRLEQLAKGSHRTDPAEQAALAYPDRIGLRRPGDDPRWLLSGGKGVKMDAADPLASQRLLVVTDTDGHPTEASIRTALAISEAALRDVLADRIAEARFAEWSRRDGRVEARVEERLGAIALSSKRWTDAPPERIAAAMLDGIRQLGFSFSDAAQRFRARVALVRAAGHDLPDMGDAALMDTLQDWLLPHLSGVRSSAEWRAFDPLPALRAMLDWDQTQTLDRETPANFETPLGRKIPIDYSGTDPEIALRLQEMFGVTRHPVVAGRPLRVTLLSPAGRPVQTTMDIPGFWATSYADVRKDMRGRYPKHPWPEDPTVADPTLRAKRRGE